jgi:subtilisin
MPAKKDEQESRTTTQSGKEPLTEAGSAGAYAEEKRVASRERAGAIGWRPSSGAIASRHPQFMVFTRGITGLQPLAGPEFLEQSLRNSAEIEVLDVLTPRNAFGGFGDGMPGSQRVIVARMDEQKASLFARQAGPQIVIERDYPLTDGHGLGPSLFIAPGSLHQALGFTATFKVLGNNTPLEGVQVSLFGSASLSQGITDKQGEVQLDVTGESPATIRALYVKPQADYWTIWIPEPSIDPSGENTVTLTPLSATFQGFPRQQLVGWGHKAMKVDQLPPNYRGNGIRIGMIDSGVTATHSALRSQVKSGYDAIMRSQQGWDQDVTGHGTHCAGIICGRSPGGSGIQGIAPEAEVIVCKVSPGGSYSNLFEALDFCIAQQVDLIHVSLGGPEPSQILEQKILQAKQLGIACIAAAGDSGGPMHYPASSPNVLAVAALGKQGEFPAQSYHAQTVAGFTAPSGFYSPNFSCFGPQIAVCAPGLAVVSSVPPDNFAACDGTAVAAAHITGLAALILAHHPDFRPQGPFAMRSAYRVERLFQLIKQSSQFINLGDPLRVGAGLPDATWATVALPAQPELMPQLSRTLHYPGFSFPTTASMPFFPGSSQFTPTLQPYGIPATGLPGPDQGSTAHLLMTIQQLRAMMQSAGLL